MKKFFVLNFNFNFNFNFKIDKLTGSFSSELRYEIRYLEMFKFDQKHPISSGSRKGIRILIDRDPNRGCRRFDFRTQFKYLIAGTRSVGGDDILTVDFCSSLTKERVGL